ncbi:MAG: glyoxalase [Bacteroidetes bacterium]|nr:MAG: glyoxalase [Bacteroidota bacterium]
MPDSSTVSVRYIVNDVDVALPFYTDLLKFKIDMHPAPGFAMLSKGNLRLLLNKPSTGGGGQTIADSTVPSPGGWNRIQIEVDDLEEAIKKMQSMNAKFRNNLIDGIGGKQILLEDPSGNLVELFEAKR